MTLQRFPKALRVEVKFTTGKSVTVPLRERKSLLSSDEDEAGIIAALFMNGNRQVDGRWFIVDAAESFRSGPAAAGNLGIRDLQRLERGQAWLAGLRNHVDETWPRFLRAFRTLALDGHDVLSRELEGLHQAGTLHDHLMADPVLDLEHQQAVRAIVETLGASVAGHIFQDLFAYLLGLAGYRRVQINPVGVPDIEVSEFSGSENAPPVTLALTRQQVERLISLCESAGDDELAAALRLRLTDK